MARHQSFEEQVLAARGTERDRYAKGLADSRGPAPYSKVLSEADQDKLWVFADPRYVDPPFVQAAIAQQTAAGKAQGVPHDTALAQAIASVAKAYPQSAFLRLMAPTEQGGQALTPLAASYTKYPNRQHLVEGSGDGGIEAQLAYADRRRERLAQQPQPPADVAAPAPPLAGAAASPSLLPMMPPSPTPPPPTPLPGPPDQGAAPPQPPPAPSY